MRDGHVGVRLMNDYACRWPVWWVEGQQAEPGELVLSPDLEEAIRAWAQHFNAHYDPFTAWDSDEARQTHAHLASSLQARLRAELGHDLEVHADLWELDAHTT